MRLRTLIFGAAALLAACASGPEAPRPVAAAQAPADPSLASPPQTHLKAYLPADTLDGDRLIGPPPTPDSPQDQADRATYLATRALAGTPRWTLAQKDNDLWFGGATSRFACAVGKELSAKATPVTYELLERVELDVRNVGAKAKGRYNRVRPPIGDDRPICIPREDWLKTNGSYPSGHSGTGWAWGLVMAQIAPEKATEMVAAGREIGDSRIVCGVHYASDVVAGRVLAAALFARLQADPAFQRDVARAKAELARSKTPAANCPA